jgi:hypothetical protein
MLNLLRPLTLNVKLSLFPQENVELERRTLFKVSHSLEFLLSFQNCTTSLALTGVESRLASASPNGKKMLEILCEISFAVSENVTPDTKYIVGCNLQEIILNGNLYFNSICQQD